MSLEIELRALTLSGVMRGLDPRIHDELPRGMTLRPSLLNGLMDCRVKPGNDSAKVGTRFLRPMGGGA